MDDTDEPLLERKRIRLMSPNRIGEGLTAADIIELADKRREKDDHGEERKGRSRAMASSDAPLARHCGTRT